MAEPIRKIVDADALAPIVDLPVDMQGHKVEIIVLPITDDGEARPALKLMGALSKYANPDFIPLEDGAWERAVADAYNDTGC